jgi:hypothetical protein
LFIVEWNRLLAIFLSLFRFFSSLLFRSCGSNWQEVHDMALPFGTVSSVRSRSLARRESLIKEF